MIKLSICIFVTLITFLIFSQFASAQVLKNDSVKVSNDNPDRPLQMPPATSEVKEAFEDYERFQKRNAWERALKTLFGIPEASGGRFVDGNDGFIIPVTRKRRELLNRLTPEGKAAYRLFYDDEAKKLLDKAEGPSELKSLERVYSSYFLTSFGDNAADRLGDLYFEMGRFERAVDCWLSILREHPDTDLSSALVMVKSGNALARLERKSELANLRRELSDRHAGEILSIGGRSASALDHFDRLVGESDPVSKVEGTSSATKNAPKATASELDLSKPVPSAWRMRFGESIVAGMTPAERSQWESSPMSGAVPSLAIVENRAYANFVGYVFALNLDNGKLLWRSGSFHNVDVFAAQDQSRMIDLKRFAIVADQSRIWSIGRDLKDQSYFANYKLTCRRSDGGEVVWQSGDLPDYSQIDLTGEPVLVEGTLFVVAKSLMNQQQQDGQGRRQYVVSIRARDGKVLWKTEIGAFRQSQRYFYYGMTESTPNPTLLYQAGSLYVETHAGILARIDGDSGELEWGYGYPTEALQSESRFVFVRMSPTKSDSASSPPLRHGDTLFIKGAKSERVFALDTDGMRVLWDRPISKSARLIGVDDRSLYLGGPELSALDRNTRELLWVTRLPGGSSDGRVLLRPNAIFQHTPRGIFEVDPVSGHVRRIFRGDDTGSESGDLLMTPRFLLTTTNRAITAYPLDSAKLDKSPGVGPNVAPRTDNTKGSNE